MRILDKNNINYTVYRYKADEKHLDAITAAKEIGVEPSFVYKTPVLQGSGSINSYLYP